MFMGFICIFLLTRDCKYLQNGYEFFPCDWFVDHLRAEGLGAGVGLVTQLPAE